MIEPMSTPDTDAEHFEPFKAPIRQMGLCGYISPNGQRVCIKDMGHSDPCGFERQRFGELDECEQRVLRLRELGVPDDALEPIEAWIKAQREETASE